MTYYFTLENKKRPVLHYWAVGLALFIWNGFVVGLCFKNYPELLANPILNYPISFQLFYGVLIGPVLETLLFQALIINFLYKHLSMPEKAKRIVVIGVPAILFAAIHYYSWAYQLAMLVPGIILAYGYWFFLNAGKKRLAFWSVCVLHMIANFLTLTLTYYYPSI